MKGTNSLSVRNGTDAHAAGRTSPAMHVVVRGPDSSPPMPAKGSSYEIWLAWYESIAPGGEFNETLAQHEVELHSAPTLPPAKADEETRAFEQLVRKVGEGQARWTRLLELLEEQAT